MMRISKNIAKILVEVDPRARAYQQPDGSILVEIRRSLYGLPEAAKLWNDYLTAALVAGGYQVCPHDPCLYVRRRGNEISIIGIYVDDCIHIYRGSNIYRELYASLRNANLHDLKIEKLEGRHQEFIIDNQGHRISGLSIDMDNSVWDFIKNFQIIQKEPGKITFNIVPKFTSLTTEQKDFLIKFSFMVVVSWLPNLLHS